MRSLIASKALWSILALCLLRPVLAAATPVILVLGDSLSAGYGLDAGQGWVQLLQQRLQAQGYPHRVVNASISGDTTRGALARLPGVLERHAPSLVIVELGGNDGLRGLTLTEMRQNLRQIVEAARGAGAKVLLVGVRLPPNYGSVYTEAFARSYRDLADQLGVALVPELLAGVGGDAALMQPDGIHPVAQAQPRMLDNVWPSLTPLLGPAATAAGSAPR